MKIWVDENGEFLHRRAVLRARKLGRRVSVRTVRGMGDLEGLNWIILFVAALLLIGFVGYQLGKG
jgi:hypothetical protein